jgi:hypothetical protein
MSNRELPPLHGLHVTLVQLVSPSSGEVGATSRAHLNPVGKSYLTVPEREIVSDSASSGSYATRFRQADSQGTNAVPSSCLA